MRRTVSPAGVKKEIYPGVRARDGEPYSMGDILIVLCCAVRFGIPSLIPVRRPVCRHVAADAMDNVKQAVVGEDAFALGPNVPDDVRNDGMGVGGGTVGPSVLREQRQLSHADTDRRTALGMRSVGTGERCGYFDATMIGAGCHPGWDPAVRTSRRVGRAVVQAARRGCPNAHPGPGTNRWFAFVDTSSPFMPAPNCWGTTVISF